MLDRFFGLATAQIELAIKKIHDSKARKFKIRKVEYLNLSELSKASKIITKLLLSSEIDEVEEDIFFGAKKNPGKGKWAHPLTFSL